MSITFKQTIIHNLDLKMGQPLLSKECVTLNDEIESFITRKLIKVMEDHGTCEAKFEVKQVGFYPEDEPYSIFKEWKANNFKHLSEIIANKFYSYMNEYGNIPSGDLIVTNYLMDGEEHVAFFKVNFNEGDYTHFFDGDDGTMRVVVNKGIYGKKVDEAVIIKLSDTSVLLLDNSKSKYISLMIDLKPGLSVKEKLKALNTVATKVIEEHYDNPIKAINELKNNVAESIARTQTIPIQEIIEQTFGDDQEVLETCIEYLETFGMANEEPIEVNSSKITNKYTTQKLKTDTGIEIKMPTHLFKDPDFIEIIDEPNGTQSIVIKNVNQIVNK